MNIVINVVSEMDGEKVVRSHVLRTDGKRACRCNVPKSRETRVQENVSVADTDGLRICEWSRKNLMHEMELLKEWVLASIRDADSHS